MRVIPTYSVQRLLHSRPGFSTLKITRREWLLYVILCSKICGCDRSLSPLSLVQNCVHYNFSGKVSGSGWLTKCFFHIKEHFPRNLTLCLKNSGYFLSQAHQENTEYHSLNLNFIGCMWNSIPSHQYAYADFVFHVTWW